MTHRAEKTKMQEQLYCANGDRESFFFAFVFATFLSIAVMTAVVATALFV